MATTFRPAVSYLPLALNNMMPTPDDYLQSFVSRGPILIDAMGGGWESNQIDILIFFLCYKRLCSDGFETILSAPLFFSLTLAHP